MISRLKDLFGDSKSLERRSADELNLAAAALMIEVAQMDGQIEDRERRKILDIAERQFGLTSEEARDLFEAAGTRGRGTSDLWTFASLIKAKFTEDERIRLIEMLWHVAYADGVLHDYEAHLLRRIAGLIYVSDHERGAARQRVLTALGLANQAADGP